MTSTPPIAERLRSAEGDTHQTMWEAADAIEELVGVLEAICSDLNDGDFVSAVQIARNAGRTVLAKHRGEGS